jgi:Rrf2 family protein
MKMSAGVEWAVHSCAVLSAATEPVPVTKLAELHGVSRTYLAKHMQALSHSGLVRAIEGRDGGYLLTRPGSEISVYDIVQAIDGPEPAFRCTEIRQRGPFPATDEACKVPCGIAQVMAKAERAWGDSLRSVTLADLNAAFDASSPGSWETVRGWLAATPSP